MENIDDLRVVELLCSHLCHELVSPVGAISNGLEMIEEFGGEPDSAVLGLIADSATITAQRLQYYRIAFGVLSSGSVRTDEDFKALADGLLKSGKSEIEWPVGPLLDDMPEAHIKLLLNVIGLAANTLPRGGKVIVQTDLPGALSVVARGEGAKLSEDVMAALAKDVSIESLSPRNIHAYFCQCIAAQANQTLRVSLTRSEQIEFSW